MNHPRMPVPGSAVAVLLVDDEPQLLMLARDFLEEDPDIRVETSRSGREALWRLRAENFDAVIADYEMPGMDGIELLRTLRREGSSIPFIIFTGRSREDVAIDALNSGADFYLEKTGTPETVYAELRHLLRQAIARHRSEEALKENERRLSTLMSNLPGMAYRCQNDRDHTMEFVSEGCRELTGYEPDAIVGNRTVAYGSLIHPGDQEMVQREIRECVAAGRPFTCTYRIRTPPGMKWVWEQGRGVGGGSGEPVALEGFISDITGLKNAEAALGKSEQTLRTLFDQARDMIFVNEPFTSAEGGERFTDVNRIVTSKLGYSRDELLRMGPADIVAPECRDRFERIVADYLHRGEGIYEIVFRSQDGRRIPVELSSRTITIQEEAIVFSIARDITERKRAEEALQESEARFRTIFEEGPLGMALITPDLRHLETNAPYARILGHTPEELRQITLLHGISRAHYGRGIAQLRRLQRGEIEKCRIESRYSRKNGDQILLSVTVSALRDANGAVLYYIAMIEDITERGRIGDAPC